jgi:hypothetical protein
VSNRMEPNMKMKKAHWGVLALVTFIALLLLAPPLSKSKPRAQTLRTANNLWTASITLARTNAPSSTTPNK